MGQLVEAYNLGLSLQQIVEIFTTKPQFTDTYETALSNRDQAMTSLTVQLGGAAFGQVAYRLPTRTNPETTKPGRNRAKCLIYLGWLMGLEPTTTGITILDSTN